MQRHRFSHILNATQDKHQAGPIANTTGFVVFPLAGDRGWTGAPERWQQQVYQWAFEQAQAVNKPSWIERDLLGVWN